MIKTKLKISKEYLANRTIYKKIDDCVVNDIDVVKEYLIPYNTELAQDQHGPKHYKDRQDRSYNVNFCEPYLLIHLGHLTQNITTKGADALQESLDNIDGEGTAFRHFVRELLWHYMKDGHVVTLVDRAAAIASNKAQARASGERAYSQLFEAKHVLALSRFTDGPRRGFLNNVILQTGTEQNDQGKFVLAVQYTLEQTGFFQWRKFRIPLDEFKRQDILKHQELEAEKLEEGQGALERIPVVDFGDGPDDSFIKSVWPLNLADYNLTSLMSNTNYNQGFQRSFVTGAKPEEIQKIGEHLVSLIANEGARIFTIEAGDPTAIEKERATLRREIHRRGKFEFNQLADDTRQAQSADSKEKDLITRRGIYDYVLDMFETKLVELLALHAEYDGAAAEDLTISIDRDYGLEDQERIYQEEDSTAALARELGAIEVQKEILKARVRRMKIMPEQNETEEEARQRLLDSIDVAEPAGSNLASAASLVRPDIAGILG